MRTDIMSTNEFINLYLTGQINVSVMKIIIEEPFYGTLNSRYCEIEMKVRGEKYGKLHYIPRNEFNGGNFFIRTEYDIVFKKFPISFIKKLKKDFNKIPEDERYLSLSHVMKFKLFGY